MRKRIFILTFILTAILILSSCHGNKVLPAFTMPEDFNDKEYNITFWAKNDTNSRQQQIYNEAVAEFNKYYPNIHVEITQYRDYTAIYSDVIKNISTQTTPNVCVAYPDHVATYLDGTNVVVPLDDLMNNEKYGLGGSLIKYDSIKKNDIIQSFLEEGKIGDNYYTIPFQRSTEALYINKTYVESLGFEIPEIVTWEYVWKVCKKAIEEKKENQNLYPLIYKSTDNMTIQLLKQMGIDYTSADKDIYLFNDDTKKLLTELQGYANNKYFEIFARVSYPGNHFNRGNCIFAIDSTAGATWLGGDAPLQDIPQNERVEFETIVKPIPQVDVNNPYMISQGPSVCIFNKTDSQEVLASWLFAQFLLNKKTQINYSQTEGYLPVTNSAINSVEYQDSINNPNYAPSDVAPGSVEYNTIVYPVRIEATKILLNNIDNTFVTPVFSGSSLVRSAAGYLIEGIFKPKYKKDNGIDLLFEETYALYNLNTVVKEEAIKEDTGNNNITYVLIGSILLAWVGIISYTAFEKLKKINKVK